MADPRTVLVLIIVALVFVGVGRRLQRAIDLYWKWRAAVTAIATAIAALPGARGNFWRGVRSLIVAGFVGVALIWVVVRVNVLAE